MLLLRLLLLPHWVPACGDTGKGARVRARGKLNLSAKPVCLMNKLLSFRSERLGYSLPHDIDKNGPERIFPMLRLIRSELTRQISFGFIMGALALYAAAPGQGRADFHDRVAHIWAADY